MRSLYRDHRMTQVEIGKALRRDKSWVSRRLMLAELNLHEDWAGRPLSDIEAAADVRVAYFTRFGEGTLPKADSSYQRGDLIHAMMRTQDVEEVAKILSQPPQLDEMEELITRYEGRD